MRLSLSWHTLRTLFTGRRRLVVLAGALGLLALLVALVVSLTLHRRQPPEDLAVTQFLRDTGAVLAQDPVVGEVIRGAHLFAPATVPVPVVTLVPLYSPAEITALSRSLVASVPDARNTTDYVALTTSDAVAPVVAFYRRELAARGWQERASGATTVAGEVVAFEFGFGSDSHLRVSVDGRVHGKTTIELFFLIRAAF